MSQKINKLKNLLFYNITVITTLKYTHFINYHFIDLNLDYELFLVLDYTSFYSYQSLTRCSELTYLPLNTWAHQRAPTPRNRSLKRGSLFMSFLYHLSAKLICNTLIRIRIRPPNSTLLYHRRLFVLSGPSDKRFPFLITKPNLSFTHDVVRHILWGKKPLRGVFALAPLL